MMKLKCCTITAFIFGFIFICLAAFWVAILNAVTHWGAKDGAALTKPNEQAWKDIPGHYDIDITHDNFFYNCTNADDVIYKGEKPIFEEYGPYIYREHEEFNNVKYDQTLNVTGLSDQAFSKNVDGSTTATGLTADFSMYTQYYSEAYDRMDNTK